MVVSEHAGVSHFPGRRLLWAVLGIGALAMAGALAVVVCSEVAGARQFLPSPSIMTGTWRSASGAVLTLRPDGTFTERGLPTNAGEGSSLNIPAEGDGRWDVGPKGVSAGVTFDFAPSFSMKVQMVLLVERVGSMVVMYYDQGDPDEGVSGQYQFTMVR